MNSENHTNGSIFLDKFLVDSEKNLFRMENNEKVLIQKLKKNIFKMAEFEGNYFIIDTFGDCFKLDSHSSQCVLTFLFGILSTPSYFNVLNNRIYIMDKYSRVWVHDLDGEIINIAFINENVLDVHINHNYCCAVTDGREIKIEYRTDSDKTVDSKNKVKIFDRSFDLLRSVIVDKLVSIESDKISYESMGNIVELKIYDHNARKSLRLEN